MVEAARKAGVWETQRQWKHHIHKDEKAPPMTPVQNLKDFCVTNFDAEPSIAVQLII